jgi:hypothetical protein
MKTCPIFFAVIREIKIKTRIRFTAIWEKNLKPNNIKCWKGWETKRFKAHRLQVRIIIRANTLENN